MAQETNPNAGRIVNCDRCNVRCRVAERRTTDARLCAHADGSKGGYCPNCAITQFLRTSPIADTVAEAMRTHGRGVFHMPHIQERIRAVLGAGRADLHEDQIDWYEVAANWDLPVKGEKKEGLF